MVTVPVARLTEVVAMEILGGSASSCQASITLHVTHVIGLGEFLVDAEPLYFHSSHNLF